MHTLHPIQKVLDHIETRLSDDVSIPELAQTAAMSLRHFQRTFAAAVGEPVGRYIRRRRIACAAMRMLEFDGTLLDLALDYGFESHEAFSRAFKSELGATPSEWREGKGRIAHPRRREIVSQEIINQRYLDMHLLPEFVTLDPATFIGVQARFIPGNSDDANNMRVIPQLWDEFFRRQDDIPTIEPNTSYGLADDLDSHTMELEHPDETLYLAAAKVDPDAPIPEGLHRWTSPGGIFAKFEHYGTTDRINETMSYIYAKWFPDSDFIEGEGPVFQRIDARFKPHSEKSVLDVFVPVTLRK